jgi:glycosyltransferase involved in cell wall biosynthesis
MNALDVCLNPQLINEITIGNYPRKVDEYLALGKPVIATTTDTMLLFKEHVYLCANQEEYKVALEKAINENTSEKIKQRILFAKSHSWENNVNQIYKQIENLL